MGGMAWSSLLVAFQVTANDPDPHPLFLGLFPSLKEMGFTSDEINFFAILILIPIALGIIVFWIVAVVDGRKRRHIPRRKSRDDADWGQW